MSYVIAERTQIDILRDAVRGSSVTEISCRTGVERNTVTSWIKRLGAASVCFLNEELRDLQIAHIQLDEIHTFVQRKQRHVFKDEPDCEVVGDQFLFTALDQGSRLLLAHAIGKRDETTTMRFMYELAGRLKFPRPHESDDHRFRTGQYKPVTRISSDSFQCYAGAVASVFGPYAEYGQLKKVKVRNTERDAEPDAERLNAILQPGAHGVPTEDDQNDQSAVNFLKRRKYKIEVHRRVLNGNFPERAVSTSLVERSNLTIRTMLSRFTRRGLGFSKNLENLKANVAMFMAHYNYCWVVKTLKTTPAVKAGIVGEKWSTEDLYYHLRRRYGEHFLKGK